MTERKSYLLISMATGCMDGFYHSKVVAKDGLDVLRDRHPDDMWHLVEVLNITSNAYIPDHLFYANRKLNK